MGGDRATQDARMQEVRALEEALRRDGYIFCTYAMQNFSASFPESCQRRLASYSVELELGHANFSFRWPLNLLFAVFMLFHARFRGTSASQPGPSSGKVAHEVYTQPQDRRKSRKARRQSKVILLTLSAKKSAKNRSAPKG